MIFIMTLPEKLIAQTPLADRSASRLMTLDRTTGEIGHRHFYEIAELLRPGDCLVLNNSRVLPARLLGHREPTGGAVEVLLLRDKGDGVWECLTKPGRKTHTGTELSFGDGELTATVVGEVDDGNKLVQFHYKGIFLEVLERLGKMPLPPYIKEELEDGERYQTVYSKINGSAAAPTAGLHFTKELLEKIAAKGVKIAYVTLHVGLGTFRPVKAEEITEHHMHSEFCMMDAETAEVLNETRRSGGRIVCVRHDVLPDGGVAGARRTARFRESSKWTEIFIYPGYQFQRDGRTDHEFPPAGEHARDAGVRVCGPRAYSARLRDGRTGTVSVFQLRRCDVHWRRDALQGRKRRKARKIRVFGGNGLTGAKSRKSRMDN